MDIHEQIEEYQKLYPPVDIYSPPGTRIIFHGKGGYPMQNKVANGLLEVGKTYTLAGSSIGNWESTFFLEEVSGGFSSVMFSPEEDPPKLDVDIRS